MRYRPCQQNVQTIDSSQFGYCRHSHQTILAGLFYRSAVIAPFIIFSLVLSALFAPLCSSRQGRTCGVEALYQVCLHNDLNIPYGQVHEACHPTEEGNSLLDIFQAAQQLGFSALGMRLEWKDLVELDSSAIAFVSGNHFVAVLEADAEGDRVKVVDYPEPEQWYGREEFEEIWKGETLAISCEGEDLEPHEIDFDAPRIRFEHTLLDVGVIAQGEMAIGEFHYSNEGLVPLIIEDVKTSCACNILSGATSVVLPGESADIVVGFDTARKSGRSTEYFSVITNDPINPMIQLTLSGIVRVDISCQPKALNLGRVKRKEIIEEELVVEGINREVLEVKADHDAGNALDVLVSSNDDIDENGAHEFSIKIVFNPKGLPYGTFKSVLHIRTNLEKDAEIRVPITAEVVPEIILKPDVLYLGALKPNEEISREVSVLNLNPTDNDFKILDISAEINGLDYEVIRRKEEHSFAIIAKYTAPDIAETFIDSNLTIITSHPERSVLNMRILGRVMGK